jgi:predicted PolB exonuclease-like 3'-5' exonuclease
LGAAYRRTLGEGADLIVRCAHRRAVAAARHVQRQQLRFERPYFHRYTEDAIDLCDVFSSFSPQGKATLHEISRVMGLPGKPKGFDGGEVERYFREGKVKEIAEYCETDVVGTYQVWLRYELFRGTLSRDAFEASQRNLRDFINRR